MPCLEHHRHPQMFFAIPVFKSHPRLAQLTSWPLTSSGFATLRSWPDFPTSTSARSGPLSTLLGRTDHHGS